MEKIIKEALSNKKTLIFWYYSKSEDALVQREAIPICYGLDKNEKLFLRAVENDIPKLWEVAKMDGVELGDKFKLKEEKEFTGDRIITTVLGNL